MPSLGVCQPRDNWKEKGEDLRANEGVRDSVGYASRLSLVLWYKSVISCSGSSTTSFVFRFCLFSMVLGVWSLYGLVLHHLRYLRAGLDYSEKCSSLSRVSTQDKVTLGDGDGKTID